jgi:uncharacterized protein (TIGR03066 family)
MRALVCCPLALVIGFGVSADDKKDEKIDAAKLIGRWEAKGPKGALVIEFTKDGKTRSAFTSFGQPGKVEGTYTVDGNKLITVAKHEEREVKETLTITKLTDSELVGTTGRGQEKAFVRVKDK